MINKETAEKLYDICNAIGDCKKALEAYEKNSEISYLSAYLNPNDSITVFLSRAVAIEAMKKRLAVLKAEYKALNEKAIEEAGSDNP